MEPCPQCGNDVWGFVQRPPEAAAKPAGVPTWHAMVFPCEHLVWLPYPTDAAKAGSRAVDVHRFLTAAAIPASGSTIAPLTAP